MNVVYADAWDYTQGSKLKQIDYVKMDKNGNFLIHWKRIDGGDLLRSPDIGSDSEGNIYIVWEGYPNLQSSSELYYSKLNKDGDFLKNPTRLTFNEPSHKRQHGFPRISIDGDDNVHIVYGNGASTGQSVLDKDGIILVDDEALPQVGILNEIGGPYSDICSDSQGVPAVFTNGLIIPELYYIKFGNNGNVIRTWKQILPAVYGGNLLPQIDVGPTDNLHLVWWEDTSSRQIIGYMKLNDTGVKLIDKVEITSQEGDATSPDIAVNSSDCAHIVWQDNRDGNLEIYYKSSCPCNLSPFRFDFGDAPDRYHTLNASNGARHKVNDIYLGSKIDLERDGWPTDNSDGDDKTGFDDEDGVSFSPLLLFKGSSASAKIQASGLGKLNAWIDFNADGDWADPDEQIFADENLFIGLNTLSFDVPATAVEGLTYSRFRFSTKGGLSYDGPADDGEVEDYTVRIARPSPPTPGERKADVNVDSIEIGKDTALAISSSLNSRLKAKSINHLEILKNQDSQCECCQSNCSDCCPVNRLESIKVRDRNAFASGSASSLNSVKILTSQR